MKKYSIITLLIFILVFSFGCIYGAGKRPTNFLNSKWVSEEPPMWFEVIEVEYQGRECYGQLILNDQSIQTYLFFNYGNGGYISIDESAISFIDAVFNEKSTTSHGYCIYNPEKLVIKIDKERDDIFNGKYKKITFIREPEESH